jgi:hypothetical protein
MAITKDDLQDFARFVDEKLDRGEGDSLVALAGEWEAQKREMDATVADIRESHSDIEAGRVSRASDAFAEIRKQLGGR